MDRILLVVAIAFLYISPSLAADGGRASEGFQNTLVIFHEDGYEGAKPTAWIMKYGQFTNEDVTMDHSRSVLGSGIGLGVAPLFGAYGVIRTSSNHDRSTYIALGFILDELTLDEAGATDSRNDSGLSYGIGVINPSFNIEYMMSMDEENYEVSAIGISFISEF
jgi:hypothetical protein